MIRRATPADADALSALARECFTQTFEYLYAPGDLAIFLDQAYSPAILRSELQDPQRATWLLFEDAVGGPSSPDEASCTPSDLVSSPGPTVHTPGEHPSIPLFRGGSPGLVPRRTHRLRDRLPHPDVAPGDGEVQRLYILRGHQGGGHGTTLLRTALEWLERDGPRTLWIGVWSENYGAQRFYARHGFEIVGEYSFMVGDHADREFITRRPASVSRRPSCV